MKKYPLILLFVIGLIAALPVFEAACQHQVALESGGAYHDPVLATTDRAILDTSRVLADFIAWHSANAVYLAKWPEVGALAASVAAQKDGWIRDAYAARDAYASAAAAYKSGLGPAPDGAKLNATIAVLSNVTSQIIVYKNSHPHV